MSSSRAVIRRMLQESETASVLAHVAGPSGSGKTTLVNTLSQKLPRIDFKDLDDFDDEAEVLLGYESTSKQDYTDEMLLALFDKRQQLLDRYVEASVKPIVFAGHHLEGEHVLDIPTSNLFLIDVDAKTSALRAWKRSQSEDPESRRTEEELPQDTQEAQEDIDWLKGHGYEPMSPEEIFNRINSENS